MTLQEAPNSSEQLFTRHRLARLRRATDSSFTVVAHAAQVGEMESDNHHLRAARAFA